MGRFVIIDDSSEAELRSRSISFSASPEAAILITWVYEYT